MNPDTSWNAPGISGPGFTYCPAQIVRPAGVVQGQRVRVVIGSENVVGSDSLTAYMVTDQKDKKGNPLLVNRDTGDLVSAGPDVVLALV